MQQGRALLKIKASPFAESLLPTRDQTGSFRQAELTCIQALPYRIVLTYAMPPFADPTAVQHLSQRQVAKDVLPQLVR